MDDEPDIPTAQQQSLLNNTEAQKLLTVAASRVWEELYVCKKPVILRLVSGSFRLA